MASKFSRITASTSVTAQPASLEKLIIGSHNGSTFSVFDGTVVDGDLTVRILGTAVPHATATYGPQEIEFNVTCAYGIFVQVAGGTGNVVDYIVTYNGNPLR